MLKRIMAITLSLALMLPAAAGMTEGSFAASGGTDSSAVYSANYGTPKTFPDMFVYSDEMFRKDSRVYDEHMAAMSFMTCLASFDSNRYESKEDRYEMKSRDLGDFLTDNGFSDFDMSTDYRTETGDDPCCVACAHKKITDGGREYTLLAVVPRSGTYKEEWTTNTRMSSRSGDKGDYAGFSEARELALRYAKRYVWKYGIKGDIKVWVTGYSGGGARANLIGASLAADPVKYLGNNVRLDRSDLYCYTFGSPRVASSAEDYDSSVYDCIHNIYDPREVLVNIPSSLSGMGRYGQEHGFADPALKGRMLEILKEYRESDYNGFIKSGDPEQYTPYKLDIEGLKQGKLAFAEDKDSYLPDTLDGFLDTMIDSMSETCAREASTGVGRDGFYEMYQTPATNFLKYGVYGGLKFEELTGGKNSVPMILSMYVMFMAEKSSAHSSEQVSASVGQAFTGLSWLVEDGNGNVKPEYRQIESAYNSIKKALFKAEKAEDGSVSYSLKKSVSVGGMTTENLKKLTAQLYSNAVKEAMSDAPEENIRKLTSDSDSRAISHMLAHLFFGNSLQSDRVDIASLDNEQFKQLATLIGNLSRLLTYHMYPAISSYLRAADSWYDDYERPEGAAAAGYRRMYISASDGASVTGTVTDGSGSTVASFSDGRIVTRTDEWVGYTMSDGGGWLRLPLDKDYRVSFSTDRDSKVSVKIAEYSVKEGAELRTADSDSSKSWSGLSLKKGDSVTASLTAASAGDDGKFSIPSGASYSLVVKTEASDDGNVRPSDKDSGSAAPALPVIYSKKIPKVKSLKVRAGRKSASVSWKKLSGTARKKYSKTEIQYSTGKKFARTKTKITEVPKSMSSYKIKKLKKGRTYYVRVRNIKYAGGKKYVSKWSAVKKVRVK